MSEHVAASRSTAQGERRKKLGVAFGGGGMKGWVHLSVGALLGAYYAFGHSVEHSMG